MQPGAGQEGRTRIRAPFQVGLHWHQQTSCQPEQGGAVAFNVGLLLKAVISFLIVSLATFRVAKALSRFEAREAEVPGALSQTEQTLIKMRDLLTQTPRP